LTPSPAVCDPQIQMKALFLTEWYPTGDRVYNGIFVREHAKAVRAAGVEVTVLHIPSGAGKGRGLWVMEEERNPELTEGIPTYHLYHRAFRFPGPLRRLSTGLSYSLYIWSVVRATRRLRAGGLRPDIIHAHVFSAGVPAVVIGKLTGTPVVITEHYTAFPRRTLSRASVRMARFAFRNAARVMPVCLFLQKAIEAYGVRARFEIVPNAVDTAIFKMAERGRQRDGQKHLLFVGNLEPTGHKGFPTLVTALEMLAESRRDWHLEVVGEGPTRGEYERLVAGSPVAELVAFRGALRKSEVAESMRAADLFVLPSRFENLPCVIIEAMASGLPVVSTKVGGIPEMMSERDGILVSPDDPPALADAIDRVLANPRAFDSAEISARAQARYGLSAVGAQIEGVYLSVAASPVAKPQAGR
jgi:glycosyltransferase involved in cell wall biosynthesis